jgi:hypothetical protein
MSEATSQHYPSLEDHQNMHVNKVLPKEEKDPMRNLRSRLGYPVRSNATKSYARK